MSYLLDRKTKRKNFSYIFAGIFILLVLFLFRTPVFNIASSVSHIVFRPLLFLGNSVGGGLKSFASYFASKNSLYLENQKLQEEVKANDARLANYDSVVSDNASLKEVLNRKDTKANMTLSVILSKPNQSAYDTLVIDAGINEGINIGDIVFAYGNIPIGRVETVLSKSSKVILFSNPGEKTQAVVTTKKVLNDVGKNIDILPTSATDVVQTPALPDAKSQDVYVELVGRGGGNFEMIMPKDFVLQKGDQATMPNINSYVLAIVDDTISDPRDPFTKALLVSPVNIQQLKFVEVGTSK